MADSNSTAKTLKIVIAILALVIVGMIVWFYTANRQQEQTITTISTEKVELQKSLDNLQETYASLKTDNDTLNAQLDQEREKVELLIEKVKKTEGSNKAQLKKYEAELGTLRSIMQNYIRQIDSLNTINQTLVAENRQVKEVAEESQRKVSELTEKSDALASKVEQGAILKARSIVGTGLLANGKENTRASRVQKLRVCFTLIENAIAEKGPRNVYLRVKGPDGVVLAQSEDNLFSYQGNQLVYSAVREVDYQGEDIEMCIFYDFQGADPGKGTYSVALFSGGGQIGSGEIVLK